MGRDGRVHVTHVTIVNVTHHVTDINMTRHVTGVNTALMNSPGPRGVREIGGTSPWGMVGWGVVWYGMVRV